MGRTTAVSNKELFTRIAHTYKWMIENEDLSNASKVKQLGRKFKNDEFTIAFCGHFSAGKSTLINCLMGDNVLPSSPIPTSANLVMVRKGEEDYAKVYFKEGTPRLYTSPYNYDLVKSYCKDGDQITSIEISKSETLLPTGALLLDTPGIDSTDEAHRLATESALHLADVVFYCMDYNHVQSEVNFLFAKELTDAGKDVYLIVNQIDKHQENELSFSDFKESVCSSFALWGVKPRKIFYTTLKDLKHPENQLEQLKEYLWNKVNNKGDLLQHSAFQSLKKLADDHLQFLSDKTKAQENSLVTFLPSTEKDEIDLVIHQRDELNQQLLLLASAKDIRLRKITNELEGIINNAYLMPFSTRELAQRYLEAIQPGFKVGLFFSKQKTEQERQQRLDLFLIELSQRVKTELEWHIKDKIQQLSKEFDIDHPELQTLIQNYALNIDSNLVKSAEKKDALLSGEYVLYFTQEVAEQIKSLARRLLEPLISRMLTLLEDQHKTEQELAELELNHLQKIVEKWEEYCTLTAKKQKLKDYKVELLFGKLNQQTDESSNTRWLEQDEKFVVIRESASLDHDHFTSSNKTIPDLSLGHDQSQQSIIDVNEVVLQMRGTANLLRHIPGFQTVLDELNHKANRLENQGFTIALFGAFSAGKSSFANALLGDRILPVSPNPTTAAINKIMPVSIGNPHGLVKVKFKSEEQLLSEVNRSLHSFNMASCTDLFGAREAIKSLPEYTNLEGQDRVHFAFLTAFSNGLDKIKSFLGTSLSTDLEEFTHYVADEEKSCFVDLIEVFYDCDLTRQGITLVDTPGADSINARHTGVAFDYIKNSDAILFVTYYNHAFSKADREFLIQLGRVKDTFTLDKMFFIVNACDLANNKAELEIVLDYVSEQLTNYGIRFPHVYPVSSKLGLESKLAHKNIHPQLKAFEQRFYSFIKQDLTSIAVNSGLAEIQRAYSLLEAFIHSAKEDGATKQMHLLQLKQERERIFDLILTHQGNMNERLAQEADELAFYIKQRVFYRFGDFFKESFNPTLLKDDGRNLKKALLQGLEDFIESIGFDFAQELRATSLRIENHLTKLIKESEQKLTVAMQSINKEFIFGHFDVGNIASIDFELAFSELTDSDFKKALSHFRNPKAFFEGNEKKNMMEELQTTLSPYADEYVRTEIARLKDYYKDVVEEKNRQLQMFLKAEVDDFYIGTEAALKNELNVDELENVQQQLSKLRIG